MHTRVRPMRYNGSLKGILKNDRLLGSSLPDIPNVTFRGALPLRLQIAPNVIAPPKRCRFFHQIKVFYPCIKCAVCQTNSFKNRKYASFQSNSTSKTYDVRSFLTCTSKNVVYIITCPCGLQYVGRTTCTFQVRMNEHIANIKKGFPKHSLSKHFDQCHDRNPVGTSFMAIDQFNPSWRGSHVKREISKLETKWIYWLHSYRRCGLNIEWDVNAFINNS